MKKIINKVLTGLTGHQLTKSNVDQVSNLFVTKWLRSFDFKTIIDVGANSGQFAKSVRRVLPSAKIISFEPIPRECETLRDYFKEDKNYELYQMALGQETGTTNFLLNDFSPTSSLLEQTELQKEFYPITGDSKEIEVKIERLDKVIGPKQLIGNTLLKIDVQGFEDQVIKGATEILSSVKLIYVECSFKEFYKGQPLFHEIYELLHELGFDFRGVGDQLNAGRTGEPTQVDAFFLNRNH